MPEEYAFGISGPGRPRAQAVVEPSEPRIASAVDSATSVDIPALNALALTSLVSLFSAKERLFYRSVTIAEDGLRHEKASRRRTIIALLGLQRLATSGGALPFDIAVIGDLLLTDTDWVSGLGDLGLLTWFTAELAPERLRGLFNTFDYDKALETFPDGRQARTTGLALFLAGISHAQLRGPEIAPDLTDVAVDAYHLLMDNQGESGVFGQAGFSGMLGRAFCRRFGTFSDQIYAIYALSTFAKTFQVEEPLAPALSCANSICALQGEMGEWWSLYDKRSCRVANRYPVFSWHQDGTAPVGLFALGKATGQNFGEAIHRGLSWVTGKNELWNDLRCFDRGLIWDSIRLSRNAPNYWEAALSLANISNKPRGERLHIRYEARPDHFGWLLYAFGGQGLPRPAVGAKAITTR